MDAWRGASEEAHASRRLYRGGFNRARYRKPDRVFRISFVDNRMLCHTIRGTFGNQAY